MTIIPATPPPIRSAAATKPPIAHRGNEVGPVGSATASGVTRRRLCFFGAGAVVVVGGAVEVAVVVGGAVVV